MIVVIPSIRDINLEYIQPLLGQGHRILVVDDSDGHVRPNHPDIEVFVYADQKRYLGDKWPCIPRKNGACRDFGLYLAYVEGSPDDIVVALDDDCVVPDDYAARCKAQLGHVTVPLAKTAHRFWNVLDLYGHAEEIFPRGFPYEERHRPKDYDYSTTITGTCDFVLGLWRGAFDVNAIDKLYLSAFEFPDAKLAHPLAACQPGALFSLCSMNMIMMRDAIPAIYQLPMNEPITGPWKIDRYGDIWGGYIFKRLADIKGDLVCAGEPMITHLKAPELNKNIRQEHFAHLVNIYFCDLLEEASRDIRPASYLDMYQQLVAGFERLMPRITAPMDVYMRPTVAKMQMWCDALGAPRAGYGSAVAAQTQTVA